jgi:predicted PurR-regulated permease PerM
MDQPTANDPAHSTHAGWTFAAWTYRRTVAVTLVVVAVLLGFALLHLLQDILFLLFIGFVLATVLRPAIEWLEGRGLGHSTATVLVFALAATALVAAVAAALPALYSQSRSLLDTVPAMYASLRTQLESMPSELARRWLSRLPEALPSLVQGDRAMAGLLDTSAQALNLGPALVRLAFVTLAIWLLSFYWTLHEERTIRMALLWTSVPRRDAARELFEAVQQKVGAYIRAQGILCLAVGGMSLLAFSLIGLPYPAALATLAGVLEAVPVFGPLISGAVVLLVSLAATPEKVLWVLLAAVVIQQAESNLLLPLIMDKSVGVNALVTLLALVGFGALFGVAGAVLAIPLAAVAQLLLDRFLLGAEALEPEPPAGRDVVSRLQYQAGELAQDARLQFREHESPQVEGSPDSSDEIEEAIETIARDLEQALADRSRGLAASGASTVVLEVRP